MKKYLIFVLLIFILSCTYNFRIITDPQDSIASINGNIIDKTVIYKSGKSNIELIIKRYGYKDFIQQYNKIIPLGNKTILANLVPEKFKVEINSVEGNSEVIFNSKSLGKTPVKLDLAYGDYELTLKKQGFPDENVILGAKKSGKYLFRNHKEAMLIKQIGLFDCGSLPKQVIFSPDDKFIYIILLDGMGYQIFDMNKLAITDYIVPPDNTRQKGFPEGLFIKEKKVFWVSQMTTGKIYEYSYPDNKYIRTMITEGLWSKFMAWSSKLNVAAVSNWESNDVSIIDYDSGKVIKKIKTAPSPRGLVFSGDGKYLYITSFDGGMIYKVNTSDWSISKSIYKKNGAMRHAVLTKDDKTLFVSDMYYSEVYEIDAEQFQINKSYKVYDNTNTISITPDNKYIYASCRGPNDMSSYLNRSPENGKTIIIDLIKKEIIESFRSGNQPTALGISNNGKFLCTSNFRDNNIELYYIGELK